VKILFWGTPVFAVPSLRALDNEGFDVVGVVTQPDRPKGRGRRLAPSPVKEVALAAGIPVFTPQRPRGDEFLEEIAALEADLSVVVAYGHILRREVLDVPPMGSINVHASVLPELRGAAPIHWAIARGHDTTGVTVMRMAEAMDAGPILHIVEEPVLADETASELSVRLSELGAQALVEALTLLGSGLLEEVEQDHDKATFAPKVDRETARVDWSRPAQEIAWHIRGMDAVPGAWSELEGTPVKLFRPGVIAAHELDTTVAGPAGNGGPPKPATPLEPVTVLATDEEAGVIVAAGDGAVALQEVQPPGKRRMSSGDWIHGRGVQPGQRFA